MAGFVPYLFYDDVPAALAWYRRVLGFVERERWTDGEGRVTNAEMTAGDTELWLDGGGRRWFDADGKPARMWIGLWVDDVDAAYERVTAAGEQVEAPVDREFGVRMLTVGDPFGYQWGLMKRIG